MEINIATMQTQIRQLRQQKLRLQHLLLEQKTNRNKELSIWQNINQNMKINESLPQIKQKHQQEILSLKQQTLQLIKQNQQLRQKVNQMKQTISDKSQMIRLLKQNHQSQIMKFQQQIRYKNIQNIQTSHRQTNNFYNEQIIKINQQKIELQKIKQLLEKRLQKCGEISKQMQQYYTSQLQSKEEVIKEQFQQIKTLKMDIQLMNQQLRRANQRQYLQQSIVKSHSSTSDYNSFCKSIPTNHTVQQKYQSILQIIKDKYEVQISNYKDKIKYLLLKIQSIEGNQYSTYLRKQQQQKIENNPLKISKNSNNSSLNEFTPNSSQYSWPKQISQNSNSKKQILTIKNQNNKTPNKFENISCVKNNKNTKENSYYKNSKI